MVPDRRAPRAAPTLGIVPVDRPPLSVLLVAGILGFLVAALGCFLQAAAWHGFPWGLVVALGLSVLVFVVCGWAAASPLGAVAAGATWVATVLLVDSWTRPEGDIVFTRRWTSTAWIYGGAALVLVAALLPYSAIARWTGHGTARPPGPWEPGGTGQPAPGRRRYTAP
jgi:hypothetical protein